MAARSPELIGITPAMCDGSGLNAFSEQFPDRYFDVGIAEQHAVTLAAGLACEGKKPVVAIYSTFLQRAYDQLIHDVAIQNLPVMFAIDRAGLVGADGPTHAGSFDLSYLRCIPNMVIMTPSDEDECRKMLTTGHKYKGPSAVRYPRGTGTGVDIEPELTELEIGKAELKKQGKTTAILAFGTLLQPALVAGEQLGCTVINMRFVKPIDTDMIKQVSESHDLIVTIEENAVQGGAGSAVNEYLNTINSSISIINLGLPDKFIDHGEQHQMLVECGLDANGIVNTIKSHFQA
jgi:1-deoxy-D-xylulose-5-phosphate synthase